MKSKKAARPLPVKKVKKVKLTLVKPLDSKPTNPVPHPFQRYMKIEPPSNTFRDMRNYNMRMNRRRAS